MLDLLAFAAAAATARCIGRKNPLLLSPSAGPDGTAGQHAAAAAGTRLAFHATLLVSLLLFSLSILEAAPTSWLVVVDTASTFVAWYRTLLWALCLLLLFVHPLLVGVVLGAALFGSRPSVDEGKGQASSPRNRAEGSRRGKRPAAVLLSILWITVRFFLVSMLSIIWRLVRKLVGMIVPYRITRADSGSGCVACGRRCVQYCSAGIVTAAFASLSFSLVSLAMLGSLTLHSRVDGEDGGFSTVAVPFREESTPSSPLDYISLRFMVSVICAFGMIVASLLNGFGCASMPHANLVGIFLKPTPTSVLAKVEDDYYYTKQQLEEKRVILADATQQSSSAGRSHSSSFTGNSSSSEGARAMQLREELIFLENLVGDMKDDLDEMRHSQRQALEARTTFGRLRGVVGVIFSIVLVVRVILAASSFMSFFEGWDNATGSTTSPRDPLTNVSLWLLGRNLVRPEQYDLVRQGTSLVLAGLLSATQVRAFFRVVGALGRRLRGTCGASLPNVACMSQMEYQSGQGAGNGVALLACSFVMGCYFLACVTVVKMTLPVEYRAAFSSAVGLNFAFNTRLLNMVFFGAACASAAALASLFGIQRNNAARYQMDSRLSSPRSQLA